MLNKSRGRPRGAPPTRARLVGAARELFVERGYQGATVRAIADRAGVDQAVINYHFGSKRGLFAASMQLPCAQALDLGGIFDGPPGALADRLLDLVTAAWDGSDASSNRLALQDDEVATAFRDYLEHELLGRIAEFLPGSDSSARAAAAVAIIGGLILTRHLNPLQPTVGMTPDEVRRVFGPPLRLALALPRSMITSKWG